MGQKMYSNRYNEQITYIYIYIHIYGYNEYPEKLLCFKVGIVIKTILKILQIFSFMHSITKKFMFKDTDVICVIWSNGCIYYVNLIPQTAGESKGLHIIHWVWLVNKVSGNPGLGWESYVGL